MMPPGSRLARRLGQAPAGLDPGLTAAVAASLLMHAAVLAPTLILGLEAAPIPPGEGAVTVEIVTEAPGTPGGSASGAAGGGAREVLPERLAAAPFENPAARDTPRQLGVSLDEARAAAAEQAPAPAVRPAETDLAESPMAADPLPRPKPEPPAVASPEPAAAPPNPEAPAEAAPRDNKPARVPAAAPSAPASGSNAASERSKGEGAVSEAGEAGAGGGEAATPAANTGGGLNNPPPRYPYASRAAGEEGRVVLRVRVSAEGRPLDVAIKESSGHRRLDRAALHAVEDWRFTPARHLGRPIDSTIAVPITFKLEE